MGDPHEQRFVLLAHGIEGVVWLYHFHSAYLNQASNAVRRRFPGASDGVTLR
jgi:hypothetical protein